MFWFGGTVRAFCSPSGRFGRQLLAGSVLIFETGPVSGMIWAVCDLLSESAILDFVIRLLIAGSLDCCVPPSFVEVVGVFGAGRTVHTF